jgi:hypothetical protein
MVPERGSGSGRRRDASPADRQQKSLDHRDLLAGIRRSGSAAMPGSATGRARHDDGAFASAAATV